MRRLISVLAFAVAGTALAQSQQAVDAIRELVPYSDMRLRIPDLTRLQYEAAVRVLAKSSESRTAVVSPANQPSDEDDWSQLKTQMRVDLNRYNAREIAASTRTYSAPTYAPPSYVARSYSTPTRSTPISTPRDVPTYSEPEVNYLGSLSANPYDPNSTSNPYGIYGSQYSPKSINNPYAEYGNPHSPSSATNPYSPGTAPMIYGADGQYLGRLSANPYDPQSTSNPYGIYGSQYSPYSINNPYSVYGSAYSPYSARNPYATQAPVVVAPADPP